MSPASTQGMSAVFFAIALYCVYRSFYGMRINSQTKPAEAASSEAAFLACGEKSRVEGRASQCAEDRSARNGIEGPGLKPLRSYWLYSWG